MDRQRIKIYANKKHAIAFYSGLFLFSTVFLITIFFNDYSWFENGVIFILSILCFSVSLFGFFTLWSGRFSYFDPETEGFDKETVFGSAPYLILEDRLQARMNANKIIFYADIIAVYAIPNFFDIEDDGDEMWCYIVVKDKFNKRLFSDTKTNIFFCVFLSKPEVSFFRKCQPLERSRLNSIDANSYSLPFYYTQIRLGMIYGGIMSFPRRLLIYKPISLE